MNLLYLVGGLGCIAFFGFGFFALFYKKQYLHSLLCLVFVAAGIWILTLDNESEDTSDSNEISQTSTSTSTQNKNTSTESNVIKPKITSAPDDESKAALLAGDIQKIIDQDFNFDTKIKELQLNNHAGTTDISDDFIALIYLSYEQPHSEETTKQWIDTYTSHLAALLATHSVNLTELVIFWETPRFIEETNTAKFKLLKGSDGVFYFEDQNYNQTIFK